MEVQKTKKKGNLAVILLSVLVVLLLIGVMTLFALDLPNRSAYQEAMDLKNAGMYIEAIGAFEALGSYKDSKEQAEQCKEVAMEYQYDLACTAANQEEYIAAYDLFAQLGSYKDSREQKEAIREQYLDAVNKTVKVGDTLYLGSYEQDNDKENGKEDIEWIVLDSKDGKLLVISKYALTCQKFKFNYSGTTWEKSDARKWLNETFLNDAFAAAEQLLIAESSLFPDANPTIGTNQGGTTTDKLFYLSAVQTEQYFREKEDRQCLPTAYAISQGMMLGENGCCWWWTRTIGINSFSAVTVDIDGYFAYNGEDLRRDSVGVRPAMWIDLNG